MTDEISNAAHFPREQQRAMTAAAGMGINAWKPIIQLQASMLRMWADNMERLAGRYEKGFEESSNTVGEQLRKSASP